MRSSCRPQSGLGLFLLGFAPAYALASRCNNHCIMRAAQGVEGHADLASSSPSSLVRGQSRLTTYNRRRGLRSLPHLREQFKPRTDDGHASPAYPPEGDTPFKVSSCRFLASVRFVAYHRIKRHDPPLVRVPVYSFEF